MTTKRNGVRRAETGHWIRWAAGIGSGLLGFLIAAILGWLVHRVETIGDTLAARTALIETTARVTEENRMSHERTLGALSSLDRTMSDLDKRLALLAQQLELTRLAEERAKGRK